MASILVSFEQTFHGDLLTVLCGMLEPSSVLALFNTSTWYNKNTDLKLYIKSLLPASVKYHVLYPECISDWGSDDSDYICSYWGCRYYSYYSGKKHVGECIYGQNLIQACKHASWAECKFQMKRALNIRVLEKYPRSILHLFRNAHDINDTLLTKIYGVLVEIYLDDCNQFSLIHMEEIRNIENMLLRNIYGINDVIIEGCYY
jgi:hypothetical protein